MAQVVWDSMVVRAAVLFGLVAVCGVVLGVEAGLLIVVAMTVMIAAVEAAGPLAALAMGADPLAAEDVAALSKARDLLEMAELAALDDPDALKRLWVAEREVTALLHRRLFAHVDGVPRGERP